MADDQQPIGNPTPGPGLPVPPPAASTQPHPIDAIIGTGPECQFIKRRHLGQGSFGSAWKVEEASTGTVLAAKLMNMNSMTPKDRGFVQNEVRCLARCSHPNIVKHILSTDVEGMLLIVMEYADGGDLYKQIKARQPGMKYFKEHEILFIFLQLCLALDHIHSKRMMHRDLKTANVLLTCTGLVKLGDFGFSRQYEDSLSKPVGSTFCGTPYYLSPELWRRAPYSKKSEMWALGVVLYEVMALRRPFSGKSMEELIDNILHARYEPLPSIYSPQLQDVVRQLLQLDPEKRPSLRDMFKQPYIRENGLLTLRRSVENHTKIPPNIRAEMVRNMDEVLDPNLVEYDQPRIVPRMSQLLRHTNESGWVPCTLELAPNQVTIHSANGRETLDLAGISSVCPIEVQVSGEPCVFAIKNTIGKAFWFKEADQQRANEWIQAIQDAIGL